MFYKNVASQKIVVFAYDSTDGSAQTGDAANITAQISLDGAAAAATNDVNPTELDATDHPGIYLFDMTQAETNADLINLTAVSSTGDILLEPVIIYTEPTERQADVVKMSGSGTAADNLETAALAYSATRGLAGTALPAAAADALGGLPISDAGGLDIDTLLAKLADDGFTAATFNSDNDLYTCRPWLLDKNSATATDRYAFLWSKNGAVITSGITVPKIQVIKYSDGTDLVAETAMTAVSVGFKYDETSDLQTAGAAYLMKLTATIDGSTRTDYWSVGRDASA